MKKIFIYLLCWFSIGTVIGQNTCQPPITLTPSTKNKVIDWQQFPEFSLPFDICYGGPHFQNSQPFALKRGFSHVSEGRFGVPSSQLGQVYYLVAYPFANQPWERLRSPWGNDLNLYNQKWLRDYDQLSGGSAPIKADWFVYDIERQIKSADSVLLLRKEPSTPVEFLKLPDAAFVAQYKKDLQNLYFQPVDLFAKKGINSSKISAYGDGPVLNTFTNIQGYTWEEWQKDPGVLNPNAVNFSTNTVGGNYYNAQNILSPSAYYYFDYPSPFASEYLTYLLFQIEVNRAWSTKPVHPFVWLKYSSNAALENKFIRPWMAEATAIFPFFSGAKGLWLWDNPGTFDLDVNYSAYEHFTYGLYRLSEFKDFFAGNYELVIEKSAHELNRTREPVWRGVVKNNNILIAAHNPNAKTENEEVVVPVKYKNWSGLVTLKGYEVFLCSFDMSVLANEPQTEQLLSVFPNPVGDYFTLRYSGKANGENRLLFFDESGRKIEEMKVRLVSGENNIHIKTPKISSAIFYVSLEIDGKYQTVKVVKR